MNKEELEIEYAKAKINFRKSNDEKLPSSPFITHYWSGVCNTYRSILNKEYGNGEWNKELYKKLKC